MGKRVYSGSMIHIRVLGYLKGFYVNVPQFLRETLRRCRLFSPRPAAHLPPRRISHRIGVAYEMIEAGTEGGAEVVSRHGDVEVAAVLDTNDENIIHRVFTVEHVVCRGLVDLHGECDFEALPGEKHAEGRGSEEETKKRRNEETKKWGC